MFYLYLSLFVLFPVRNFAGGTEISLTHHIIVTDVLKPSKFEIPSECICVINRQFIISPSQAFLWETTNERRTKDKIYD